MHNCIAWSGVICSYNVYLGPVEKFVVGVVIVVAVVVVVFVAVVVTIMTTLMQGKEKEEWTLYEWNKMNELYMDNCSYNTGKWKVPLGSKRSSPVLESGDRPSNFPSISHHRFFLGTVEDRYTKSKTEEGRFWFVRLQGSFSPASIVYIL